MSVNKLIYAIKRILLDRYEAYFNSVISGPSTRVKGMDSETHIWPCTYSFRCVHIHLDVTVRVTKQIPTIYPIISTQSSIENYAKMRLESRRLSPYLFTCDVTHSLSVESHLQAFVLHFILSIKFAEKKKEIKTEKKCHLSQGSRGRRTRRPGTSKSGLRHMVFFSGDSRGASCFCRDTSQYLPVFCCL